MTIEFRILAAFFMLSLIACSGQTEQAETITKEVVQPTSIEKITETKQPQNIIQAGIYRGIEPGSKISTHGTYTEKTQLKTAEGTFEIYRIKDDTDENLGYFLPDPRDETSVGDIIIDVLGAKTMQGIQVGDSFGDLSKEIKGFSVNGSETEGRTYVNHEGLSYRLDTPNFSYIVDANSVPMNTEILEIIVKRAK